MSSNLSFVDTKISDQHHAGCYSRALLATLFFMFLCVFGGENDNPVYQTHEL